MTPPNSTVPPPDANVLLNGRCGCGSRPPIRLVAGALFEIRQALGYHIPADRVVQTYRCSKCGTTVPITAADLLLASS